MPDYSYIVPGVHARGWRIRREASSVIVQYGAIELTGRIVKHLRWARGGPRTKVWRYRSVRRAKEQVWLRVAEKTRRYDRLQPGKRILRARSTR